MTETREMIDLMNADGKPAVGFALVMWDSDGGSAGAARAYPGSNLPGIAIPDFARNRLLATKIIEWCKP